MDANLDKIAKDLYGKIQTRFRNIKIGDENAEVLSKKEDIPRARFFEFEYEEGGAPLGTIAITLDPEDGIVIQVSGDLTDDNNSTHHGAYRFIRGFRQFAKDRLLNFDVQNIGKSNLDKRDYEYQAKRKEMPIMPSIMENKLYGSNRISYQDLGEARLVIKHNQPINMDLPAGRTMHIESIYIENAQGERFKYPFKHINGARALAEHIKHGGNPYDNIGSHICSLSEELAHLRKFKGYISRQEQLSEAMSNVTSRVLDRIEEIKETINKLQRSSYYESFVESFEYQEEQMIPEEIQNDLIDRLTIRTFNEELKAVFPYIYKFVDESELPVVELSADDLLAENPNDSTPYVPKDYQTKEPLKQGPDGKWRNSKGEERDGLHGGPLKPGGGAMHRGLNLGKPAKESVEDQFESFLNDIVREDKNEVISPNKDAQAAAIEKLNTILAQNMQVGPNGDNAIMTLKGLIDEPNFIDAVKSAPAETDLNDLVKGWVETEHEELLSQLQFPSDEVSAAPPAPVVAPAPAPAPAAAAPVEPAPAAAEPTPAPVAEGKDDEQDPPWDVDPKDKKQGKTTPGKHGQGYSQARHLARQGLADTLKKAKKAGATLETQLNVGGKAMTIAEIIEGCGMEPQEIGFDAPQEKGLPGMLKYISGFYNKEEGNFPLGGMRVKIKVKKAFEDGEFGGANPEDLIKVIKFIDAKDPSGNEHNQITRLAGVQKPQEHNLEKFDISTLETQLQSISESPELVNYSEDQSLARIIQLSRR